MLPRTDLHAERERRDFPLHDSADLQCGAVGTDGLDVEPGLRWRLRPDEPAGGRRPDYADGNRRQFGVLRTSPDVPGRRQLRV